MLACTWWTVMLAIIGGWLLLALAVAFVFSSIARRLA